MIEQRLIRVHGAWACSGCLAQVSDAGVIGHADDCPACDLLGYKALTAARRRLGGEETTDPGEGHKHGRHRQDDHPEDPPGRGART